MRNGVEQTGLKARKTLKPALASRLRGPVKEPKVNIESIRANAFAMPLTSPAFPRGPCRFTNREFLIIAYRTDPDALRTLVPEPLEIGEPLVKFEFIRMPDSTGFGDYTESGQEIPVSFRGAKGSYAHAMYLNDHRRLPVDASSGDFQRNSPTRNWKQRLIRWWVR
jgi:acetoacetate decarboxylase